MNISSTEFEKKCEEIMPKLEAKIREERPNVTKISRFFELSDTLRLNFYVEFKSADGEMKSRSFRVGADPIMNGQIQPVVDAVAKAID